MSKELAEFDNAARAVLADTYAYDPAEAVANWERLRPIIGAALLRLIDLYPHRVVIQRRVLFFKVTITANDLRGWVRWAFRLPES